MSGANLIKHAVNYRVGDLQKKKGIFFTQKRLQPLAKTVTICELFNLQIKFLSCI
jgi:hypothetical protein